MAWEHDIYKKVMKDKRDRVFITSSVNYSEDQKQPMHLSQQKASVQQQNPISKNLNTNVHHIMKIIPWNQQVSDSSSSTSSQDSDNESNNSIIEFQSVTSQTDSEIQHISTPSESESQKSHQDSDKNNEQEQINLKKMQKKARFPKTPLYLDDTLVGQGKHMHVV